MFFNRKLLKGFNKEDLSLVKYVLFTIDQDLRINDYIINSDTSSEISELELTWSDSVIDKLQDILVVLLDKQIIVQSYKETRNCRYELVHPLFVNEEIGAITDVLANECRKYFSKSYCGVSNRNTTTTLVKQHLNILVEGNPDLDVSIFSEVCKYMVDDRMKENKTFVPNILNFINAHREEDRANKDLLMYYEEYQSLTDDEKKSENTDFSIR